MPINTPTTLSTDPQLAQIMQQYGVDQNTARLLLQDLQTMGAGAQPGAPTTPGGMASGSQSPLLSPQVIQQAVRSATPFQSYLAGGGPSASPAGGPPPVPPAGGPPGGGPQQPPMNSPTSGQTNPPSPGGGSRGGGNDKTASDYSNVSSAKPSPDTSHSTDPATNGPNQPATPPDAPAQSSDPNQAGPQSSNGGAYPGTTPAEQATQFYGFGQQDTPETYAARIFKGAGSLGSEKGFNGLDFSDERVTGSPWGQFLQSRYLPEVQSDMTLGRLAGGDDSADSNMNMARSVLQNVANGGGAPAGGGMAALKSMAGNLDNFDPTKTSGMSQSQASTLEQLYNDPKAQAQTILGQMQGATGGWGMNFLRNELANQAQLSYDNPSQYPLNSFASRVMPMIGMG